MNRTAPFSPLLRHSIRLASCLLIFLVALIATVDTARASLLSDWNLLVETDLNTQSHVDGSAKVGGNVTGSSSLFSSMSVTDPFGDGLVVGNNIDVANLQINNSGNLRIGGTTTGNVILNGGTQSADPGAAAEVAGNFVYLDALSATLAALAPNGTLDGAGNLNATPVSMGGQLVAVYNLNASSFSGLGQLNLNFGSAQTVILNISGSPSGNVNFVAPPNMLGGFQQNNSAKILWNLYDVVNVTVNNSFNGALLAPGADLKMTGGAINGTVAVHSLSFQDAEIHRFTYTGYLPNIIVPEPSSAFLAASALALVGCWIRRRR